MNFEHLPKELVEKCKEYHIPLMEVETYYPPELVGFENYQTIDIDAILKALDKFKSTENFDSVEVKVHLRGTQCDECYSDQGIFDIYFQGWYCRSEKDLLLDVKKAELFREKEKIRQQKVKAKNQKIALIKKQQKQKETELKERELLVKLKQKYEGG